MPTLYSFTKLERSDCESAIHNIGDPTDNELNSLLGIDLFDAEGPKLITDRLALAKE